MEGGSSRVPVTCVPLGMHKQRAARAAVVYNYICMCIIRTRLRDGVN